jgi:glycosyltransferase involved in cell wall biosynthesis
LILAGSLLSKDFEARLIRDAAGDARIRFMGPLSPKQLIQVLDEADLGVVPSRWHETGPLTVLEARARGLPIVGARRGGIAELCAEDRSARLFDPDDHVELAALIAELAGDPAQLDQMTSAVPTARTIQDVAKDVRALYEDLLERRSP